VEVAQITARLASLSLEDDEMENRNPPSTENGSAPTDQRPIDQSDFNAEDGLLGSDEISGAEDESELELGGDIGFDRVVRSEEAGLGGGLDQAEEARLGVTDEELAEMARQRGVPQ
jgi:hypothetical protein